MVITPRGQGPKESTSSSTEVHKVNGTKKSFLQVLQRASKMPHAATAQYIDHGRVRVIHRCNPRIAEREMLGKQHAIIEI